MYSKTDAAVKVKKLNYYKTVHDRGGGVSVQERHCERNCEGVCDELKTQRHLWPQWPDMELQPQCDQ